MDEDLSNDAVGENDGERASHSALLDRAFSTIVGRGGVLATSFAFAIVVARLLAPAGRGDFALLQALNGLTLVAANFAIQGAIIHGLGRGRLDYRRALGAALALGGISGLIAACVFIPVALGAREELFGVIESTLLTGAIVLATPLLVREYLGGTLIVAGKSLTYVLSHAMQPAGALVLLPLVWLTTSDLVGVSLAWAGGILLSSMLIISATIRSFGRPSIRITDLRELASFGARTYPAIVARFLNLRLDQFLVASLTSTSVLGLYAVAVNMGELLIQIPVAMLWAVSGAIGKAERLESGRIVQQFCRWALLILTSAAVLIALVSPIGIPLVFGPEYRGSVSAVWALLPGMIFHAPALIISEFFIVQRALPSRATLIAASSVTTNVVANLLLTSRLGVLGAGLASSISYGVMLLTAATLFAMDAGVSVKHLLAPSRHDFVSLGTFLRNLVRGQPPTDENSPSNKADADP